MSEKKLAKEATTPLCLERLQEFHDGALRSIVGCVNGAGGRIYLGVDETGRATGVENPAKLAVAILQRAREEIRPNVDDCVACRVEERDGTEIVVVDVSEGPSKPYRLAQVGLDSTGTPSVDSGRVANMTKESFDDDAISFESARAANQSPTFLESRPYFQKFGRNLAATEWRSLGFQDENGAFTNLAALFADQAPSILKIAFFDRDELLRDSLDLKGSVIRQFHDAREFVDQYSVEKDATRAEEIRASSGHFPIVALNEALVNAILHRDYRVREPILVRRYHDRVEIVSPGTLMRGVALDDLELGVAATRNPQLAKLFNLLGYAEGFGVGIRRLRQAYDSSNLHPNFDASANYFKTTLWSVRRESMRPTTPTSSSTAATVDATLEPLANGATISASTSVLPQASTLATALGATPKPLPKEPVETCQTSATPKPLPSRVADAPNRDAAAATTTPRRRRTTTIHDALSVTAATTTRPCATIAVPATNRDRETIILDLFRRRDALTPYQIERAANLPTDVVAKLLRRLVANGSLLLCGAGEKVWYRRR